MHSIDAVSYRGFAVLPEYIDPNGHMNVGYYSVLFDKALDLPWALLGLFGNEDAAPTPEQVNQHEAELKKHGKQYEFHRYDGAGHGFFYYDRPNYRIEQALDGWKKVWAFFEKHLSK